MLLINAIREFAQDAAPDPLTALINVLQIIVLMLALAYVVGLLVSFNREPADNIDRFMVHFYGAAFVAIAAFAVLELGLRGWKRPPGPERAGTAVRAVAVARADAGTRRDAGRLLSGVAVRRLCLAAVAGPDAGSAGRRRYY